MGCTCQLVIKEIDDDDDDDDDDADYSECNVLMCRKFTSITDEDHCSIFEPVEALMRLTANTCIAVRFPPSLLYADGFGVLGPARGKI